jgi:hypothetical protein
MDSPSPPFGVNFKRGCRNPALPYQREANGSPSACIGQNGGTSPVKCMRLTPTPISGGLNHGVLSLITDATVCATSVRVALQTAGCIIATTPADLSIERIPA